MISSTFRVEATRVGLVDSDETTSLGRLDRNAPRQLIVRGTCHTFRWYRGNERDGVRTPLNPMHFSPTSRISSAVWTDWPLSFEDDVARLYSSANDSGEFIVMVVAVYAC